MSTKLLEGKCMVKYLKEAGYEKVSLKLFTNTKNLRSFYIFVKNQIIRNW